jgi:hypothetical protein
MDHQDLTVELINIAGLSVNDLDDAILVGLEAAISALVSIDARANAAFDDDDERRTGLGFLHFKEQRFYSVKLGNVARDRLGSLGLGGALISSTSGIASLVTTGALTGWAGAAALAAIVLTLVGRGKPFISSFGLDEATALDLAWRHSRVENGFRLVDLDAMVAGLDEVEAVYRNAGFTINKLTNSLGKLLALRMVAEAGPDRYQLVEKIIVAGTNELNLTPP